MPTSSYPYSYPFFYIPIETLTAHFPFHLTTIPPFIPPTYPFLSLSNLHSFSIHHALTSSSISLTSLPCIPIFLSHICHHLHETLHHHFSILSPSYPVSLANFYSSSHHHTLFPRRSLHLNSLPFFLIHMHPSCKLTPHLGIFETWRLHIEGWIMVEIMAVQTDVEVSKILILVGAGYTSMIRLKNGSLVSNGGQIASLSMTDNYFE